MTDHSNGNGGPEGPLTDPAPPPATDDDDFEQLAAAVAEAVDRTSSGKGMAPVSDVSRTAVTEPAPPSSEEPEREEPAADPESAAPSEVAEGGGRTEAATDGESGRPSQPGTDGQTRVAPVTDSAAAMAKLKDQLLRSAADYDNFRKRTKRDIVEAERRGREDTIRDLLPIFDNLERAVAASEAAADTEAIAQGVRMVLKQFEDVGSRIGIQRVQCIGAHFDPSLHDAVQQLETDEQPPGTIVKEIVPGYRLGERLIRPAMVVVARPVKADAEPEPSQDAADGDNTSDPTTEADLDDFGEAGPGDET